MPKIREKYPELPEDWEIFAAEFVEENGEINWDKIQIEGAVPSGIWPNQKWDIARRQFLFSTDELCPKKINQLDLFSEVK